MNKKTVFVGCIALVIIIGIIAFILVVRNLRFEGSSTITSNGTETTTYTPGKFLEEIGKKLDDFYTIVNTINLTADAGSASIQKIDNALMKLEEVNNFNTKVDNLQGEGSEEYKKAISTWYSGYKSLLTDNAKFIAEKIDENGQPKNSDEIDAINEKLTELNTRVFELTEEINNQGDTFYEANY